MSIVKKRVRQSRSLLVAALALVVVSCSGGSNTGTGGTPTPINPNPALRLPPPPQYVSHSFSNSNDGRSLLMLEVVYSELLACGCPLTGNRPLQPAGSYPMISGTARRAVLHPSEQRWGRRDRNIATFYYRYPSPGTRVVVTLMPGHVNSANRNGINPFAETVVLPAYTAI